MKIFNYQLERIGLRRKIIRYFKRHSADYPQQYVQTAESLRHTKLTFLPAALVEKYKDFTTNVLRENGLPYVVHQGKKLFFRADLSDHAINRLYRGLVMEQDPISPHNYQDSEFSLHDGDTLMDIGCAEGIFALTNIDKLEHAYIFECDDNWIAPLQATFAPYGDKITIIRKYISSVNDDMNVTIDNFVDQYNAKIDFIKMDIEGMEIEALNSGLNTIRNNNLRLAVCCYHRPFDCQQISDMLTQCGYLYKVNDGLLCYKYQPYPPYFRRGVVKGYRN